MNDEDQFTVEELDNFVAIQNIHPEMKMTRWGQNKLLLLLPDIPEDKLMNELEYFLLHLKRRKKLAMAAGVGGSAHPLELGKSFNEAERAVAVSKRVGRVVLERELRFELIIQSLPETTCEEFIRRTVEPLGGDIELLHNLRIWFSENQSMQNTAQRLHIHKNTLTYRLQKVEQLTGLSVSDIHDVFLLYLGIRLWDERESRLVTM